MNIHRIRPDCRNRQKQRWMRPCMRSEESSIPKDNNSSGRINDFGSGDDDEEDIDETPGAQFDPGLRGVMNEHQADWTDSVANVTTMTRNEEVTVVVGSDDDIDVERDGGELLLPSPPPSPPLLEAHKVAHVGRSCCRPHSGFKRRCGNTPTLRARNSRENVTRTREEFNSLWKME